MDNNEEYIPLYMQGKYNNDKNKLESKPISEQKAFAYQTKWLQTKDPKVWEEWTALMFSYTRSLVLKKLTRKKYMEPDEIDDITSTLPYFSMKDIVANAWPQPQSIRSKLSSKLCGNEFSKALISFA